jgi:uncharacterized protein YciI
MQNVAGLGGALLKPEYTGAAGQDAIKHLGGSMFIVEADKIEDVRKYVEEDIYWRENVVRCFA